MKIHSSSTYIYVDRKIKKSTKQFQSSGQIQLKLMKATHKSIKWLHGALLMLSKCSQARALKRNCFMFLAKIWQLLSHACSHSGGHVIGTSCSAHTRCWCTAVLHFRWWAPMHTDAKTRCKMTTLNVTACGHIDSCNTEFVASIDFSCVGLWLRLFYVWNLKPFTPLR